MRQLDPVLAGEIQVSAPNLAAMQQLIDQPTTAILSFYTTHSDTHVFVLRQNAITLHTCIRQGLDNLQAWIKEQWLLPYLSRVGETKAEKAEREELWYGSLSSFLAELAPRLQINNLIQHLQGIEEIIIVPHLSLHQIPFAALPIADNQYLGDKFLIRYTPSCQILEFCHQRNAELETAIYGTVEDAEDNLSFANSEGDRIAQLYNIPKEQRLIAALWCVNDLACAVFSIFYYEQIKQGKTRPAALQQAQIQLRQLRKEDLTELSQEIASKRSQLKSQRNQYSLLFNRIFGMRSRI